MRILGGVGLAAVPGGTLNASHSLFTLSISSLPPSLPQIFLLNDVNGEALIFSSVECLSLLVPHPSHLSLLSQVLYEYKWKMTQFSNRGRAAGEVKGARKRVEEWKEENSDW